MQRPAPIMLLAALLGACATGPARPLPDPPAAVLAGPPEQCIPIVLIRESVVRTDAVIDFVMRDRRVFRNTLPSPCPGLAAERRISYRTPLSQLCAADLVTVVTTAPIGHGATCALGAFHPVTLPTRRGNAGRR